MYIHYLGTTMKKKLFASGNSWALLIPKALLELLELNPDEDEIEINIENKKMIIEKADKK